MGEGDHGVVGGRGVDGPGRTPSEGSEGEAFGPYRLVELLGRGGMGEVWRAYDTRRARMVALKRLASGWADVAAFRQRFSLEARATAQLSSEHVIVIHDYGEIDGQLFIDMRLISGGDLAGLLAAGRGRALDPVVAVDLCGQIADGLDAAHRQGLIHRDVKPSNVLLAPDVSRYRAYLVDFGIAKLADELTGAGLTVTGATVGTPAYMAPELFVSGSASRASDVYALGCVLFEMLTGRRVFLGSTHSALMAQHADQAPPPPSSVRGELAGFDSLFARVLAKAPEARPASAGALAQEATAALSSVFRGPTHAGPTQHPGQYPGPGQYPAHQPGPWTSVPAPPSTPPASPGAGRPWWRSWRGALVAVVAVLVIAGVAVVGVAVSHPSTPPPTRAVGPVVPGVPQRLAVPLSTTQAVTFSPDGRRAYIPDITPRALLVVDVASGAPVASVPLPNAASPFLAAISPDGTRAYVTDGGSDEQPGRTVFVVDTTANSVIATVPVGVEPLGVVVSPDGRRVYVANYGTAADPGRTVSVIDTATNAVAATVPVGVGPSRLAISPDGKQVYVPEYGSQNQAGTTLTIIDTATNTPRSVPAADKSPAAAVVSPDGRHVYIICNGTTATHGSIQVLDTTNGTLTPLGTDPVRNPLAAALSPDGRTLVVPNYGTTSAPGSTVSVIDTVTGGVRSVTLTGRPYASAVDHDGHVVWVTTQYSTGVWRIPLDPG